MRGQPLGVPGYEVPLHRSLTEPILIGGAPRNFVILNDSIDNTIQSRRIIIIKNLNTTLVSTYK